MVLLIDNYDSFVFNLQRYLRELGCATRTERNDRITVEEIAAARPRAIVISPGPCTPREAGVSVDVVRRLGPDVPILGVCLGHQAIAAAYGGNIVRSPTPMHGRESEIVHSAAGLFAGLPNPLTVGRYHSLTVDDTAWPAALEVTARSSDGLVMALKHREHPVYGVQFHPESILTTGGHRLLANFLSIAGLSVQPGPPSPEYKPAPPEDDFYRRPIEAASSHPW